jgi:hypothetical protein
MGLFCTPTQYFEKADATAFNAGSFSVGCWFYVTTTGSSSRVIWEASLTATDDSIRLNNVLGFLSFEKNHLAANTWGFGPSVAANIWYYTLCREISITNHRVSMLTATTGQVQHSSDATSSAVTTNNVKTTIGATHTNGAAGSGMQGGIAEWFVADGDIVPGGGAPSDSLIRQLAYYGPFSVPSIAAQIYEYRGLVRPGNGLTNDYYARDGGFRALWVPTGSPIVGPHPPLSGNYVRPGQNLRSGIFA